MSPVEIDWTGTGWRAWRVAVGGLLRNPWANSGQTYLWNPGEVQVAECFWIKGVSSLVRGCGGYVSARCSCGIRSMSTLSALADFMAESRQLARDPYKATVVGRVRIGGKVQHRIPGLPAREGYQRSEYAEIVGPLYVSPLGIRWQIEANYGPGVAVQAPDFGQEWLRSKPRQQEWLELLAESVAARVVADSVGAE